MNKIWYDKRNIASFCKVLEKISNKNSKSIACLLDDVEFPTKGPYVIIKNLPHKLLVLC